ncbi:pathogenesis-related protein 1 [Microdochium nivale]|nr:pathogenesis-related protein 1 [Microdochium nivale]
MLFYASTALLLSSLALANPVPESAKPDSQLAGSDLIDTATIPINVAASIVLGSPALLDLGLDARDLSEDSDLSKRAWSADQKSAQQLHNQARIAKGLPRLLWDAQLAGDAKAYAQQLAASGKFEHSPNESRPGQGENLAYSYSSSPIKSPISSGTKLWLAEAPAYMNEVIPNGNFEGYGHYTQCMWKNTKKVGIAAVSDGKGAWYVVARYSPPGNIVGQKPY